MTAILRRQHIELAHTLPAPLQTFFRFWQPPPASAISNKSSLAEQTQSTAIETPTTEQTPPLQSQRNPFAPYRHPDTGRWHPPTYSLRRQAQIVKLAREHGIEELLPPTKKASGYREQRREELGLRVKGTGVGQKVKGKHAERTIQVKQRTRKTAMKEMPKAML